MDRNAGAIRTGKKRTRINKTRMALTIVVVCVAVMFAFSVKNIIDLHREQVQLKRENVQLKKDKAALEKELESINDENYIEEQARTQLNMVMPGETLYITEDGDEKD